MALFGTPKWIELYRGRIENFMDQAGSRNVPVLWVLLPVMRTPEGDARRPGSPTRLSRRRRRGGPNVTLVPTWP